MTAVQPSGGSTPNQTTEYVYGVGGTALTNIFSNDLIAATEYPDPTTGAPSSSSEETYAYDWQGEKTGYTDRNNTTHAYTYDVLGRMTLDDVTTFGSNINTYIEARGYSFNDAGLPYQQIAYTPFGGSPYPIYTDTDTYNGFGQLISEAQPAGTVTYGYSTTNSAGVPDNSSRLVSTSYPDGRTINNTYGGVSAISSITYSGTTATVNTTSSTGLTLGQPVTIQGAAQAVYDGTFTIMGIISATEFTYTLSSTPTANASGADMTAIGSPQIALSSITYSTTTATATSVTPLGMTNGTIFQVNIQGASNGLYDGAFNAMVTGTSTFTYTMTGTPSANASGSALEASNPMQLALSSITYSSGLATGTASSSLGLSTGAQFTFTITGASPNAYDGTFTATVTGSTTFTYTPLTAPGSSASSSVSGQPMIVGLDLPSLDDAISRVSGLEDQYDGTILAGYQYLGESTIVQQDSPQSGVVLTYINQPGDTLAITVAGAAAGDRYTGLDLFGRVIDQYWTNLNSPTSPVNRVQYGYDADGNMTYRDDLVNTTYSQVYTYDNLNRLTGYTQGTINSGRTAITGTPTNSATYTLDAVGNMTTYGSGSRTVNAQNEITSGSTYTPAYNADGDLTSGLYVVTSGGHTNGTFTYDAWNDMVSTNFATFNYDADGRRFETGLSNSPYTVTDSVFSVNGQILEDDAGSGASATHVTYVWGLDYVNDLVSEDQTTGYFPLTSYHVYAQHDLVYSVTSMVNIYGGLIDSQIFDPYGTPTEITGAPVQADYNFIFQGGRYDQLTQTYWFDNREYAPALGTWLEQDPAGYPDGASRYGFVTDDPETSVDPYGLAAQPAKNGFLLNGLNYTQEPYPGLSWLFEAQVHWNSGYDHQYYTFAANLSVQFWGTSGHLIGSMQVKWYSFGRADGLLDLGMAGGGFQEFLQFFAETANEKPCHGLSVSDGTVIVGQHVFALIGLAADGRGKAQFDRYDNSMPGGGRSNDLLYQSEWNVNRWDEGDSFSTVTSQAGSDQDGVMIDGVRKIYDAYIPGGGLFSFGYNTRLEYDFSLGDPVNKRGYVKWTMPDGNDDIAKQAYRTTGKPV